MIGIQCLDLDIDILRIQKGKNPRIKSKCSLRNHMLKTGCILVQLGSLDTLGLLANLSGLMKSKWDETYFNATLIS